MLKIYPDEAGLHYIIDQCLNGLWCDKQEKTILQQIEEHIQISLSLDGEDPAYFYTSGVIQFNFGNFQKACDNFEAAVRPDPENTEYLCDLADVYAKLGRHDNSLDLFKKTEKIDPNDANTLYQYGDYYYSYTDNLTLAEKN